MKQIIATLAYSFRFASGSPLRCVGACFLDRGESRFHATRRTRATTSMDISTAHLILSYMEERVRNEERVDREWEALNEHEPAASNQVAYKPENREKNRSGGAVPYDHCRVVLDPANNRHGSDYINASFISDDDPRHSAYIAAQSPLPESAPDFWQLVWEQGSASLVLLSDCSEAGSVYWPIDETPRLYHIYEVRLVSEHSCCPSFCVRSFYVRNMRSAETRSVAQFHFREWPANGVPASADALLEFRRKVNKSYRNPKSPPIVHCSDGAGRTGTFCLIDLVLNRLARGAREIDIAATLEHLRDQRPLMVHNKKQFEFALAAVALEINDMVK